MLSRYRELNETFALAVSCVAFCSGGSSVQAVEERATAVLHTIQPEHENNAIPRCAAIDAQVGGAMAVSQNRALIQIEAWSLGATHC